MDFGNHTNSEILGIISSGQATYGDTVFSTDLGEKMVFDGTFFKSVCSCAKIGVEPICNTDCPPVTEGVGSFTDLNL